MIRSITLLSLASFFLPATLPAQIAFGGQPYGDKAEKRGMPRAAVAEFHAVDVAALMQEDAARAADGLKGPFRFGFEHGADYTLQNSGSWFTMPNGDRVWRLQLHCPGALAINLQFSNYVIPEGARMFLYNEAGAVRGAFTAQSNPGHTAFGTAPLEGDRITVEYIEPPGLAGQGRLTISQVIQGYRLFGKSNDRNYGDSAPCNVNTICPEGDNWRQEIRSVAHVVLGGGVCTGTLVNNCANDSTPYFLTANHCTGGNNTNASWVFIFNWESPVCSPTENAPMDHSITGCDKLFENPPTDASFLRLSSKPPADFHPYYSGWDKSGTTPDTVHCIHHPSGDIKKISSSNGPFNAQNIDVGNGPADCWHVPQWNSGTTEPGSSGSALWNQAHLLIGQLYGGQASCSNNVNDYFGQFHLTYPHIEQWLGTCGDVLAGFDPEINVPAPLDAAITSIAQAPRVLCNTDSLAPVVTLKNNGTGVITYVNVNYFVDGAIQGTVPWYGNLHPVQTVNIQLPALHLPEGLHWVHVSASNPNGGTDTNPGNNTDSLQVMVNQPGITAVVKMNLDRYGSETTWKVESQEGYLLAQGGPYNNSNNGYTVNTPVCLAHDCYTITVMDAVGDGMCCNYGHGGFVVTDSNADTLLAGSGSFQWAVSDAFCVNWVGIAQRSAPEGLQVMPNPGNGLFTVQLPGNSAQLAFRVHDALGRAVWSGTAQPGTLRTDIDLRQLPDGCYLLVAEAAGSRSMQRIVVQH